MLQKSVEEIISILDLIYKADARLNLSKINLTSKMLVNQNQNEANGDKMDVKED